MPTIQREGHACSSRRYHIQFHRHLRSRVPPRSRQSIHRLPPTHPPANFGQSNSPVYEGGCPSEDGCRQGFGALAALVFNGGQQCDDVRNREVVPKDLGIEVYVESFQ